MKNKITIAACLFTVFGSQLVAMKDKELLVCKKKYLSSNFNYEAVHQFNSGGDIYKVSIFKKSSEGKKNKRLKTIRLSDEAKYIPFFGGVNDDGKYVAFLVNNDFYRNRKQGLFVVNVERSKTVFIPCKKKEQNKIKRYYVEIMNNQPESKDYILKFDINKKKIALYDKKEKKEMITFSIKSLLIEKFDGVKNGQQDLMATSRIFG